MHEVMEKLEEQVKKELEKIVQKNDMSPTELENAKKAVCLVKEIQEVKMGEAIGKASDYSEAYSNEYHGSSYRRGRDSNTGRYTSRNYGGPYYESQENRSRGGNSYERGYSGHSIKDRMIANLEHMMDEEHGDYERQAIANAIHRLSAE